MSRASKAKQRRRAEAEANQAAAPRSRSTLWIAAGAAAAVIAAVVVAVVVVSGSGGAGKSPGDQIASDQSAPAELAAAADAVGFHETTDPGSGTLENQAASASPPPRSTLLFDAGANAPDFTLQTPQGETVKLSDLRGKAVLLEFFATWCGLCDTEAPHLKKLAESLDPEKIAFLSVNADAEDAGSVFAYHRFYKLPFPSVLDPSVQPGSFNRRGLPGPVTQQYGMKSLPTFYVIDPKGVITWRSDGEQPDAKLREELERAAGS